MSPEPAPTWNSLEIAKLIISALTPILITIVGVFIHRVTKRFEHFQWRNQKLIEKRLSIYDQLAPILNDNLCYFTYVGSWKEKTPNDVILSKRCIDKQIHLAAPLFSIHFFEACMRFQNLCFETYTGWGQDAKLRTHTLRRQEAMGNNWNPDWSSLFSESVSDPNELRNAYKDIMTCFSDEIGINDITHLPMPGRIPAQIQ